MKRTSLSIQIIKPAFAVTLAVLITCGLSVRPAQAGYIVTLQQVGPNVVATGSGAIDLTGLAFHSTGASLSYMVPSEGNLVTGPRGGAGAIDFYTGLSGPTSFGPGPQTLASSGSGDFVGIAANGTFYLLVPQGYVSNNSLSDSSTYTGQTFSSLGVTTGTYEWTWGTGANQSFTLEAGVAAPDTGSTFGLLLLSFAALFGASRLRFLKLA